jgi:16S rRNA (adenine1518-N6/adenine1519-N6)-dimethyltransferase
MKAKKSLGQNFFVNESLGNKIVETLLETQPSTVVEIGPGKGFFTEKILKNSVNTIVIEKDNDLAEYLKIQYPNLKVLNEDFLDLDLNSLNLPEDTAFFGSLPYNVSKPIIRKILESNKFTKPAYFIIQKEVAEKYIAIEPNNNILSVNTTLFAKAKKLFDISKGSFRPVPKVTSSFIKFTPDVKILEIENLNNFQNFIKQAFTSPRKTVRNNLKSILKGKDIKSDLLEKRPQQLSLQEFVKLFTLIF